MKIWNNHLLGNILHCIKNNQVMDVLNQRFVIETTYCTANQCDQLEIPPPKNLKQNFNHIQTNRTGECYCEMCLMVVRFNFSQGMQQNNELE